jgi:osmoprotectant transport system ATP-binding protein
MALTLRLSGVSKRFGDTVALHATDLEVEAGTTTALLGVSGCGKSTLLRLVCGLLKPDAGEVRIGDEVMGRDSALRLRHRMGYVIQDGGLFPHMTARENITVLGRHLGREARALAARVEELTGLTRMPAEALDRYPGELSGGQRQRVALMRALALDPEVLLLDEPLGALDPITRRELQDDLSEIFAALGKTVLIVTHDVREAAFFGDVVVLMQDGRVVQRGPMAELVNAPSDPFVTRFLDAQRAEPIGGAS